MWEPWSRILLKLTVPDLHFLMVPAFVVNVGTRTKDYLPVSQEAPLSVVVPLSRFRRGVSVVGPD